MREHEAERARTPWRWHPWFKRISAATHVSMLSLLGRGAESSLAARKDNGRDNDRESKGETTKNRDRDRDQDRDREGKHENERKAERTLEQETNDKVGRDGDGDGRNDDRGRRHERQDDETTDADAAVSKKQQGNRRQETEQTNDDPEDTEDPEDTDDGGGGGGGGRGGRGDGGGNDAGNAGSGFFDNPLATKARRRADEFDNADRDEDEGRIIVDVDPEGESVYETDSILFATGPDGVEIETGNITFFAEPPPPPEPLPRLELPVREPGFPFGEDFPFGNTTTVVTPTEPEPSDPGDTAAPPAGRAEPIPAVDEPEPADTDGGDNTMDFSS
jgi:hypothetical protein